MNHHRPTEQARIFVSPPHMSAQEPELLLEAFDSNWIAPLGPHVEAFEREFAEKIGVEHAVALSSGTAALHLAMLLLGLEPGDEVATSTLTFAATANAIRYVGARPVFIDSEMSSWNLDPDLLAEELEASRPARAADQGRAGRRRLRPMCRLPAHPRLVPLARHPAGRGRRRGLGGHVPRADGGHVRADRLLLLQRQQDHHHQLGRDAGHFVAGMGRPGPLPGHPGPQSRCRTTSIPRSATTTA